MFDSGDIRTSVRENYVPEAGFKSVVGSLSELIASTNAPYIRSFFGKKPIVDLKKRVDGVY